MVKVSSCKGKSKQHANRVSHKAGISDPTHGSKGKQENAKQRNHASILREGYAGFCPLEIRKTGISGGGGDVEKKHWTDLDPQQFFDGYVKARKPLVISTEGVLGGALGVLFGLKGECAAWALPGAQGMKAMRNSAAASCEVLVERRTSPSSLFGQSDDATREKTTFGKFCDDLQNGNELTYLTTQALEDDNGCPKLLAADHVLKLLNGCQSLRPDLIGKLTPVQYNMWFGRSSVGSSSGLHHDFHDNIYVLLRGKKEFRLFSPRCLDVLAPAGIRQAQLHSNGLISYVPGLRDDGAPAAAVHEWRSKQAKLGSSAPARQPLDTNDSSEDDELELEQMLNDALAAGASGSENAEGTALPDSFCRVSTMSSRWPVPKVLEGRHITASLSAGDLLYLPASWFHEVISYGGDSGGHLALNVWMAPPHQGSMFQAPYEDGFWESFFEKLKPKGVSMPRGSQGSEVSGEMMGQTSSQETPQSPGERRHKDGTQRKRLPFSHRACLRLRNFRKGEHAVLNCLCSNPKDGSRDLNGVDLWDYFSKITLDGLSMPGSSKLA